MYPQRQKKKHAVTVFTYINATEIGARKTKSSRGGGESNQYLCWHLFPAWPVCLSCHQPSLQPGLVPCQLARLTITLTLPVASREAEMGHRRLASHITRFTSSFWHTHTHSFSFPIYTWKQMNALRYRKKQTGMHNCTSPLCFQSARKYVWAVY